VHIVEPDPHRIIANGIDREDHNVALSANRLALRFGMPLHFGRGAGHAEQFRGKAKRFAIVERDTQRAAIFGDPDFYRPSRSSLRRIQATILYTLSIAPL
jgi:hypothetical protein